MSNPLVSVVVPTRNQFCYLPACLDSIMFQDYPALEVIVVNDASTDVTASLLRNYARGMATETASYLWRYRRIRGKERLERRVHPRYPAGRTLKILENARQQGTSRTYNTGFRQARGRHVTYVASDDLLHPEMISSLVKVLETGSCDFVYSDLWVINETGGILREFRLPDFDYTTCLSNWYLLGVSKLYRRELHDEVGYYDENFLANDYELYLRFARHGARFRHLPRVLYSVRHHGANRRTGVHSPAHWRRLMEESKLLARRARRWHRPIRRRSIA